MGPSYCRTDTIAATEIPVHCIIEELSEGSCLKCTTLDGETKGGKKLLDSFAIVDGRTLLSKLNDVVLTALGYTQFVTATSIAQSATLPLQNDSFKAKGLIQIDNWKPLSFDQITDNVEQPIERLLKHIGGNRWTLKILVPAQAKNDIGQSGVSVGKSVSSVTSASPDESSRSTTTTIQDTLAALEINRLSWLPILNRYHPYLSNYVPAPAPTHSPTIATLLANQLLLSGADVAAIRPPSVQVTSSTSRADSDDKSQQDSDESQGKNLNEINMERMITDQGAMRRSVLVSPTRPAGHSHGHGSRHTTLLPTCRLMFDPLTELPMLNEWFEQNSHPTCHDIEKYTQILNSKSYRRTYPPVSTHNVKIWYEIYHPPLVQNLLHVFRFKNRRAKCKRI